MKLSLAIKNRTTIFQGNIKDVPINIFKPGKNNNKLGNIVLKGRWKGKKIYSLTLIERETCPPTCHHWDDCYGNHMWMGHRFKPGKELEEQIKVEIPFLLQKHPKGIVVRLHVLGDFYSLRYTNLWRSLLRKYSKLMIFGYTAFFPGTPIGDRIQELNAEFKTSVSLRISDSKVSKEGKLYAAASGYEDKGFLCPESMGRVENCAGCCACWQSNKTVIFPTH